MNESFKNTEKSKKTFLKEKSESIKKIETNEE